METLKEDTFIAGIFTEEAFTACYRHYWPAACAYAARRIGDAQAAADVAQDVFEQLWRIRDAVRPDTVRNLLFTLVRHAVTDHLRHDACARSRLSDYATALRSQWVEDLSGGGMAGVEQCCHARELGHLHAAAARRLPERRRRIYRLYWNYGLSYAAIAQSLCISERTVGTQLRLAFRTVRDDLEAQYRYRVG